MSGTVLTSGPVPASNRRILASAIVVVVLLGTLAVLPDSARGPHAVVHPYQGGGSPSPSPSRSTPFFDNLTQVEWLGPNQTLLATSAGANVSQGSLFKTSVRIACPIGVSACSGTVNVSARGAESLGSYPPWVAPCGYVRFATNITASNLPFTIVQGGTAIVNVTLQAPVATFPNSSQVPVQYDYYGFVQVTLTFAP